MSMINLEPNTDHPDDLYAAIVAMTAGLTDAQALVVQARFILLLANQIGDVEIVTQLAQIAANSEELGAGPARSDDG
jgi:hypothetical protein